MSLVDQNTMLVVVQYPDFFGRIYDYTKLIEDAHAKGALVCIVANPTALIMLKTPAEMGADIVVGEAQPFGIPLWYGGPYLGFFTTKKSYVHKMAGRLIGETVDNRGQRSYVLTLTAREQHIKRERATSNICSNQGLLALASAVYMSTLGKTGLQQVANLCYQKAHYAASELSKIDGFGLCFNDTILPRIRVVLSQTRQRSQRIFARTRHPRRIRSRQRLSHARKSHPHGVYRNEQQAGN